MRAIVITRPGGPEVLSLAERPTPEPRAGEVLIAVKAFGLNRAELYFRSGAWGEVAEISGIECAGVIQTDPEGGFAPGQKVVALMGGMGRTRNGSYAEFVSVPRENVVAINTDLPWEELAALPESYATAWTCLVGNLQLASAQTLVIRGATSALGQAALNIANGLGVRTVATTRRAERAEMLYRLGAAHVLIGASKLAAEVRDIAPTGVDAVLDLIGTTSVLDSLAALRRGGRVCLAGFLGGGTPLDKFDPVFQMPSGVHLSTFASAFAFGTLEYPLGVIPFQDFADNVARGAYQARPARVFGFADIQAAHRLMETDAAGGKVVLRV
ncbi:NADPH:quinone reductase-like Zn-dependent oxidoreductase [Nitrospirillum amazonense]|uniref:NADPH:quinone reductase-like Zn-dependent oxidoreductase n=1 Tax=Nitrospirillum amazonense TaxID=28077 RepID=A0A560ER38_9PROT|nr:zinc-binding dehydrogenase [Nitrospirillum amazonense]TWB11850.1 NADPH:quinone reductase-like Zn-dependent oxidoreductase [Nitrospirillum amazonense]